MFSLGQCCAFGPQRKRSIAEPCSASSSTPKRRWHKRPRRIPSSHAFRWSHVVISRSCSWSRCRCSSLRKVPRSQVNTIAARRAIAGADACEHRLMERRDEPSVVCVRVGDEGGPARGVEAHLLVDAREKGTPPLLSALACHHANWAVAIVVLGAPARQRLRVEAQARAWRRC